MYILETIPEALPVLELRNALGEKEPLTALEKAGDRQTDKQTDKQMGNIIA